MTIQYFYKHSWFGVAGIRSAMFIIILCFAVSCSNSGNDKQGKAELPEKIDWNRALKKDTEYHYLFYGDKYPEGQYVKEAEERYEELDAGTIDIEVLKTNRFTGHLTQFEDRQVFSLRFKVLEEKDELIYFRAMVNLGAVGKSINGTIDPSDNIIQFIEVGEGPEFQISDGKLYNRDDKTLIESTDLEQYWILD